jgi:hypothetical protein
MSALTVLRSASAVMLRSGKALTARAFRDGTALHPWCRSGLIVLPVTALLVVISPLANWLTEPRFRGYDFLAIATPLFCLLWSVVSVTAYLRDGRVEDLVRRAWLSALAAMAVRALPFFQTVLGTVRHPYSLWDGHLYKAGWLLAQGRPIYHRWDNPLGGIDALYPPLFYVLLAGLLKILPPGIYLVRCLVLSGTLGATVVSWRIVYSLTQCYTSALAACLFLFTGAIDYLSLIATRPDSLALFFSLAAFAVALSGIDDQPDSSGAIRPPALMGSAALCFLAAMCKQNYIASAAAIGLYLLFQRRWRSACLFGIALGGTLLLVTSWLNWMTDGRYLFLTWRILGFATYGWSCWYDQTRGALIACISLSPLPVAYLWRNLRSAKLRLTAIYLVFGWLSTLAAAKDGAHPGYALQAVALFGIAWGRALHPFASGLSGRPASQAALLLAGITAMCFGLRPMTPLTAAQLRARTDSEASLVRLMRRLPGTFVDFEPYRLMQAGQTVNSLDGDIDSSLSTYFPNRNARLWEDLAQGKYNLAIARPVIEKTDYGILYPSDWTVLEKHHRALRRDEFKADEMAAYENYVVLVPCPERCGLVFPDSSPMARPGRAQRTWRLFRQWIASLRP